MSKNKATFKPGTIVEVLNMTYEQIYALSCASNNRIKTTDRFMVGQRYRVEKPAFFEPETYEIGGIYFTVDQLEPVLIK